VPGDGTVVKIDKCLVVGHTGATSSGLIVSLRPKGTVFYTEKQSRINSLKELTKQFLCVGNAVTRLDGFEDRREVTACGMKVRCGSMVNLHGGW
jgi:hypothetical protein